MDTISRENNSYLPVAGLIVGVLGLVLSGVALAKVSSTKKEIAVVSEQVAPLTQRVDEAESQVRGAVERADRANNNINSLQRSTQDALTQVGLELGNLRGEITKVQEARVAPKAAAKAAGPVVAGPDEYVIKAGDTFAKIARAQGTTIADLQAVNAGVDSAKLKVGQKIKLPAKR